jgi:hypothetical protein
MANNQFYVKRTSTTGRQPNTTGSYATNSQYISAGELALNMTDQILYTSDGTNLITVGANVVNKRVTGNATINAIIANNSLGLNGQVLTSNGSTIYWSTVTGGTGSTPARQLFTANGSQNTFTVSGGYTANNLDVYLNGVKLQNGVEANVQNGSTFTILTGNPANSSVIEVVGSQIYTSNTVVQKTGDTLTGSYVFGNGTFTKAGYGTGDILLDNGSTDTPGVLLYYGNNSNFGIDSWNGSFSVLSGQMLRFTNNLNESGGNMKMAIDTTGNMATTGFIQAGAYRAGQVIKDIMLGNSDLTVSATTIATSTTDTDFISYSYTPVSNSSYLFIHFHLAKYTALSGTGTDSWFSRIKVDGNEIIYAWQSTRTSDSSRTGSLFPLMGRFTVTNTASKSIVIGCRRDSADDSIVIDNTGTSMWMRITEVAR